MDEKFLNYEVGISSTIRENAEKTVFVFFVWFDNFCAELAIFGSNWHFRLILLPTSGKLAPPIHKKQISRWNFVQLLGGGMKNWKMHSSYKERTAIHALCKKKSSIQGTSSLDCILCEFLRKSLENSNRFKTKSYVNSITQTDRYPDSISKIEHISSISISLERSHLSTLLFWYHYIACDRLISLIQFYQRMLMIVSRSHRTRDEIILSYTSMSVFVRDGGESREKSREKLPHAD